MQKSVLPTTYININKFIRGELLNSSHQTERCFNTDMIKPFVYISCRIYYRCSVSRQEKKDYCGFRVLEQGKVRSDSHTRYLLLKIW